MAYARNTFAGVKMTAGATCDITRRLILSGRSRLNCGNASSGDSEPSNAMPSIAEPMQCANTSIFPAPVSAQTWCTATGMSAIPASSKVHGALACGMPALVRKSAIQTSRPRSHSAVARLGRTAWCAKVVPLAL